MKTFPPFLLSFSSFTPLASLCEAIKIYAKFLFHLTQFSLSLLQNVPSKSIFLLATMIQRTAVNINIKVKVYFLRTLKTNINTRFYVELRVREDEM